MFFIRRWIVFSFLNCVKERIASLTAFNSRAFMCQNFSSEDHKPPVVISWHEALQPFFDASENMVGSGGTINRDFLLYIFMLVIHNDSSSLACWYRIITDSIHRSPFFSGPVFVSVARSESEILLAKLI